MGRVRPPVRHLGRLLLAFTVLATLFVPAAPGSAHAGSLPAPRLTSPTAPATLPAAPRPQLNATSFDWDGMGFLTARGLAPGVAGGAGASLVVDDPLKTGVMFGGEGAAGLTNVTLTINQTSAVWVNVTRTVAPSPRANFSFASDPARGFAVLFGGLLNLRSDVCGNETWVYWFANRTWENVTRPHAPPPRESGAFGLDPGNSTAVLLGGWDPAFRSGGSTGVVTWNDTWALNLTTFNWTLERPVKSPGPIQGAAMTWAPAVHSYLLFGGCFIECTNALWQYVPGGNWTLVVPVNHGPSGRAATTFAWAPAYNLAFVFGGYTVQTYGLEPHNDTFSYDPVARSWQYVQGPPDPFNRYDAPGAWLNNNQCPGLFLIGGNIAILNPPADQWFLDPNPDTEVGCNTWGNDRVGSGNGSNGSGLPPGCVADANLSARLISATSLLPIFNGTVSLSGYCGPYTKRTDAHGYANFSNIPAWLTDIKGTADGYRPGATSMNFTPNATSHLVMRLTPFPVLRLHTIGVQVGGARIGLYGVGIWIDGSPTTFYTDSHGWWNTTALDLALGPHTFTGQRFDYSEATATVSWPFTGPVWVNLTMDEWGGFTVRVQVAGTTIPIPGAIGTITPLDVGATTGVTAFTTPANGTVENSLPAGNYTVSAGAAGFLSNSTRPPVYHPWATSTVVTLNLTFKRTFTADVHLRDAVSHRWIANGTVTVGSALLVATNESGWGNVTGIFPAGKYAVVGSATGYHANSTSVTFSYFANPTIKVELNLTPLSSCPPNCTGANATPPFAFTLLPPVGWAVVVLTTAPLLLAVGALSYLAGSRRRAGASPQR